jgi:hypothetical protein
MVLGSLIRTYFDVFRFPLRTANLVRPYFKDLHFYEVRTDSFQIMMYQAKYNTLLEVLAYLTPSVIDM